MTSETNPPEIFDRRRRRALRERASRRQGDQFLWTHIAQDLGERLTFVTRAFEHALIIGPIAGWQKDILPADMHCTHMPLISVGGVKNIQSGFEERRAE